MLIRDVMTTNVITATSNISIYDAREIMRLHKIERLPVVDEGKLVGILTKDSVLRASPSPGMARNIWELTLIMHRMTVKDIMKTQVVTISPDLTVESAIALAQRKRVGSLLVLEDNKLVGVVTTNDFFYRILNPLLGIGVGGKRIIVYRCDTAKDMRGALGCVEKHGVKVISAHFLSSTEAGRNDFVLHLDTEDANQVMAELRNMGYSVELRPHTN